MTNIQPFGWREWIPAILCSLAGVLIVLLLHVLFDD